MSRRGNGKKMNIFPAAGRGSLSAGGAYQAFPVTVNLKPVFYFANFIFVSTK